MRFTEAIKKEVVNALLQSKKTVSEISLQFGVSRKTIYIWLKKKDFSPKYRIGKNHPNAIYPKAYRYINRYIVAHPEWGARTIQTKLFDKNITISHVQINSLLHRIGAENYQRRLNYKRNFAGPGRFIPDVRLEITRKAIEGESVSILSNYYKISRKTIYEWISKYRLSGVLNDRYASGEAHPNAIYPKLTESVLNLVSKNPEYSVHTLSKFFKASSWTIWAILDRNNLNTRSSRVSYAQNSANLLEKTTVWREVKNTFINFLTPNLSPAPPPANLIKPFFYLTLFLLTIFYLHSKISSFGSMFATISLACGMIFFLYSLKYYLTLAVTLSHSPKGDTKKSLGANLLEKYFFKSEKPSFGGVGLDASIGSIRLTKFPFISVHIPLYNERNVVERAIKAATSFKYGGDYEVILCDDSTDATSRLITKYQRDCLFKNEELKVIRGDGWSMTSVEVRPGVTLKHLHRTTRNGFKGAALSLALKVMNPKAEYISVFDADFVPYSDSLELFLKYFQFSNNKKVAAVQGYQWHVLNKSENWITRGVRSEYAGSYVVERSGEEIYGGLKQISGSVYMIKRSILEEIGWGTSITEDFELTLKLYEKGYKVLYTPYIQAPAECASTLRRLVGQRMRWAEGHSFNVKKMFKKLIFSPNLTLTEKLEFLYLSPYYLQALFFIIGTLCWLLSEAVFKTRLPFWTEVWGWSLILTNMLALPLVNAVGLFMEESENKDYLGLGSFFALSYILVPFQAYAAVKGFIEKEEGPWFRTPKTGKITDFFARTGLMRFITQIIPNTQNFFKPPHIENSYLTLETANTRFNNFKIKPKNIRWIGNAALAILLLISITITLMTPFIPQGTNNQKSGRFKLIGNAQAQELKVPAPPIDNKIYEPEIVRYKLQEDKSLEYIFHPEPRVRIKLGNKEIEIATLNLNRSVNSTKDGMIYTYKNVLEDTDLRYTVKGNILTEDFILKSYRDFESIDQSVKLTGLTMAEFDGEIAIADLDGGSPLFKFPRPFMYEVANPEIKNYEINFEIEKVKFGYIVKKVLTDEGKLWLADKSRSYPIVIDPPTLVQSSPITSGITEAETDNGSFQRKIVYSDNASAWYAFDADGGVVHYKKCLASSNCDSDGDWGGSVSVSTDTSGQGTPSVWFQRAGTGDGKIFAAWIDDANAGQATLDSLAFRTVDTANSDTLGTQCNSADQGTITELTRYAYIAVGNNGDALVGYHQFAGTLDTENDIFEVPTGGCTYTSRETSSGLPTGSVAASVVPLEVATNRIVLIYNDNGGTNALTESQFDISSSTWNFIDNDVDGANSLNINTFSAVSDGTDIWVLRADSATETDFFRCVGCTGDLAHSWTVSDTVPWSSQANITEVSLSYIATSPSNNIVAMILKDTTNEQAYFKVSDADTISWSSEYNLGFTAGDNGNLSSTYYVANDTEVGLSVREAAATSFSTLPENIVYYLLALPIIAGYIKHRKRKAGL